MFKSNYFPSDYFNEYFKISASLVDGGSGAVVNYGDLRKLELDKDDQDILEFVVSFVLSR